MPLLSIKKWLKEKETFSRAVIFAERATNSESRVFGKKIFYCPQISSLRIQVSASRLVATFFGFVIGFFCIYFSYRVDYLIPAVNLVLTPLTGGSVVEILIALKVEVYRSIASSLLSLRGFAIWFISHVNNRVITSEFTLGFVDATSLVQKFRLGHFSHGNLPVPSGFKCFCLGYWWFLIKAFVSTGPDSLSLIFKFLTLATMPVCLLLTPYTIKNYILYSCYLCTVFGFLLWCFHTTNLLSFFIAFEALALPVFLMLGIWGSINTKPRRLWASWLFLFFTLVSAGFMFVSIMYLDASLNSTEFSILFTSPLTSYEKLVIGAAFFISFAAKLPVVPFHIWLPEAHVEAPTTGSIILASLLLKLGSYGFLRFFINFLDYFLIFFSRAISFYVLFSVIYTCLVALRQTDMKKIIAYSSVSHMNLILLGFLSGTLHGYQGFLYVSVGHGFVAGGLFFLLHVLYDRYHTRELHYFSGLGQIMPLFSLMLFIFCIANFAFPGTVNFIGETLVLQGIIQKYPSLLPYVLLGLVLTTGFTISFYTQLIYGTLSLRLTKVFPDLTRLEFLILAYLAGFVIVGGLHAPAIFFNMPELIPVF